jgi:hypothetical protein
MAYWFREPGSIEAIRGVNEAHMHAERK